MTLSAFILGLMFGVKSLLCVGVYAILRELMWVPIAMMHRYAMDCIIWMNEEEASELTLEQADYELQWEGNLVLPILLFIDLLFILIFWAMCIFKWSVKITSCKLHNQM